MNCTGVLFVDLGIGKLFKCSDFIMLKTNDLRAVIIDTANYKSGSVLGVVDFKSEDIVEPIEADFYLRDDFVVSTDGRGN